MIARIDDQLYVNVDEPALAAFLVNEEFSAYIAPEEYWVLS